MSGLEIENETAKFDLVLNMSGGREVDGRIVGVQHGPVRPGDDERMLRQYERLLEGISRDAGKRISECRLLSEEEREQLVVEVNRTEEESYPLERAVAELFEEQVRLRPEAVALVQGEEEMSYGEVNERANQLAQLLRERGIGAGGRVGLCLRHSFGDGDQHPWGAEGGSQLRAAGAGASGARLRYMIADAGLGLVLTSRELRGVWSREREREWKCCAWKRRRSS